MLERKRKNKHYDIVPGEDDVDLELGEQETGTVAAAAEAKRTVTEELDEWDENADDEWAGADATNETAEAAKAGGDEDGKRRAE
jgi:hypothetical protein